MSEIFKCPKCGSIDVSMEDHDVNSGGCDPECCGGPYYMKEVHCGSCRIWERLSDEDLDETWGVREVIT